MDAASSKTWAAFHAYRRAIDAELYPGDPVLDDAECEYAMRRNNPLWETQRWLAFAGSDVVGSADASYRRTGTSNAEAHARHLTCFGSVLSEQRRKKIGSALLQEVLRVMHALDRTVLTITTHTGAGHGFLQHIGAVAKLGSVESRATLAELDWPRLRDWEDSVGNFELSWECYGGRVPRPVLLALLPAFTTLIADIPVGSLELAPIRFEIESYDQWYDTLDRTPGAHHLILLREPSGAAAGMSEAFWDSRTPEIVYQFLTAVARPWRGRGLARALKAAMLREVRASHSEVRTMHTSNAETNAAILSINQRVGFRPHCRYSTYQVTRAELDASQISVSH